MLPVLLGADADAQRPLIGDERTLGLGWVGQRPDEILDTPRRGCPAARMRNSAIA